MNAWGSSGIEALFGGTAMVATSVGKTGRVCTAISRMVLVITGEPNRFVGTLPDSVDRICCNYRRDSGQKSNVSILLSQRLNLHSGADNYLVREL